MKLALVAVFVAMPFATASACPVEYPRLFSQGPDLPANPTLIYEREWGGDTLDVVVESDGHPVPFRATMRDEYIQLDVALASGPLEVRVSEGIQQLVANWAWSSSTTTGSYWVGSHEPVMQARMTGQPLRIESNVLLHRLEWEDGAVEPWSGEPLETDVDALFYGPDSDAGRRFRLVGLFADGRTETILESVCLGPGVIPLGLSVGEPVSGRAFAGLVICLLLGLVDVRRLLRQTV